MQKKNTTIVWVVIAFIVYIFFMYRLTGGLCIFKAFFGLPCPACGSTRAILLLGKGDVKGCMELNPTAPLLLLCLLNEIRVNYFRKGDNKSSKLFLVICVLISCVVYIIRMKMYFPFREPYVYERNCVLVKILKLIKKI